MRRGIVAWLLAVALLTMSGVPPMGDAHAQADVSLARGWQHVLLPGLEPDASLQLVPGGPGLVAYSAGPTPSLWTSADGRTWERTGLPVFQSGDIAGKFFAVGSLFLLAGASTATVPNVPRVWASQDAGRSWQQSAAELEISALSAGGDGVIAFSRTSFSTDVWTSADGLRWRQLPDPNGVFAAAEVDSVTRGGPGYVAGGEAAALPAIWTSPDGLTWSKLPIDAALFGTPDDLGDVYQVVASPRSVLALGEASGQGSKGQHPFILASPDGVHWQQGSSAPFTIADLYPRRVASWRDGFVYSSGVNALSGESVVYSSPDGRTWTRVGSDELFGGSARISTVVSFGDGVAAVGSFALHPKPACKPVTTVGDLRQFTPAMFVWTPQQSASSPPPGIDPSDPRLLNLHHEDLPPDFPTDVVAPDWGGIYVNLCDQAPALGRHRAYRLFFAEGIDGEALTVVTGSTATAKAAFRHATRLFSGDRTVALPVRVRIGEETRAFRLRRPESPSFLSHRAFAVVWRQGRVIGGVLSTPFLPTCIRGLSPPPVSPSECKVAGLALDIELAQKQLAHVRHPSA